MANNIAFKGNLIIRGKIKCLTGLHIGGSKEKMEIGGVDSIVLRSPASDYPYIPGSSLKGKMRHLLEYISGGVNNPLDAQLGMVSIDPAIVRVFGIGADVKEKALDDKNFSTEEKKNEHYVGAVKQLKNIGLSRLIVRDAFPDDDTIDLWENLGSDLHYTEYKAENTIDRVTSAANPRFIERVVEGSTFDFEMVYTAYQTQEGGDVADTVNKDVMGIFTALRLLEATALGKSGSRGYGKIAFHISQPVWVMAEDYKEGSANWKTSKEKVGDELDKLEDLDLETLKFPA